MHVKKVQTNKYKTHQLDKQQSLVSEVLSGVTILSHVCSVATNIVPDQDLCGYGWKEQGIPDLYILKKK